MKVKNLIKNLRLANLDKKTKQILLKISSKLTYTKLEQSDTLEEILLKILKDLSKKEVEINELYYLAFTTDTTEREERNNIYLY